MQSKHPGIIALIATSAILLAACRGGSEPPVVVFPPTMPAAEAQQTPGISTNSGLCQNDLFPVKPGATWTYLSTGGPGGDFAYTNSITEVRENGFILSAAFADLTRTQEWSCEPGGLKALQLGGDSIAGISTQTMTAEFTTIAAEGLSLPREITPGMQWQFNLGLEGSVAMPGEQQTQSTGAYSVAMQALGRESVTVPAGTFEAVKIQATTTVQLNADFQGVPVPITANVSSILWFAPGVGFIKSIENSDFSGSPYTATTELQTYTIP